MLIYIFFFFYAKRFSSSTLSSFSRPFSRSILLPQRSLSFPYLVPHPTTGVIMVYTECTNDIINQVNCKARSMFLCNDYFNSSIFVSLKIAVGVRLKINEYILKPVEWRSKNTNLITDRSCVMARVGAQGAISSGTNYVRLGFVVCAHSGQRHRSPTAANQYCPATCRPIQSRHFAVNTILTCRTNAELQLR